MTPNRLYAQAIEFARRGFAALVVMRRGYGNSGGDYAENSGPCDRRDYLIAAKASVSDLRAAIAAMNSAQRRHHAGNDRGRHIGRRIRQRRAHRRPAAGPRRRDHFAGGRGSRADDDVCDEDALVRAFATFGKTSRTPMLWVYAANDKFFGPKLARRLHGAFTDAGGRAQFIGCSGIRRRRPHPVLGSRRVDLDADGRWFPARAAASVGASRSRHPPRQRCRRLRGSANKAAPALPSISRAGPHKVFRRVAKWRLRLPHRTSDQPPMP